MKIGELYTTKSGLAALVTNSQITVFGRPPRSYSMVAYDPARQRTFVWSCDPLGKSHHGVFDTEDNWYRTEHLDLVGLFQGLPDISLIPPHDLFNQLYAWKRASGRPEYSEAEILKELEARKVQKRQRTLTRILECPANTNANSQNQ